MIINYDNIGFRSIVTTIGNSFRTTFGFDNIGFRSIITTHDLDFHQIIVVTSTGGC